MTSATPAMPALDVVEEAVQTLRRAPLRITAWYYLATLPFALLFIYFWADMAFAADARARLGMYVVALSIAFVWMKTGQAQFGRAMGAYVADAAPPAISIRGLLRTAARQTAVQATGWLLLPPTVLILAPFGWLYAFYQNMTALDRGDYEPLGALIRRAARQAALWPKQNHVAIWFISPFPLFVAVGIFFLVLPVMMATAPMWSQFLLGVYSVLLVLLLAPLCPLAWVVALNVGMAVMMLPQLLRMLAGIETPFTIAPEGAFNSAFVVMVCLLTYLILDPVVKTTYVLRCFYGEARHSGVDLRLALRRAARVTAGAALVFIALALSTDTSARAQEAGSAINPAQLDEALDEVFTDREFSWRIPREPTSDDSSFIVGAIKGIIDVARNMLQSIRDFLERIGDWFKRTGAGGGGDGDAVGAAGMALRIVLAGLIVALSAAIVWYAVQAIRRRPTLASATQATDKSPDIAQETTSADQLPSSDWLRMARELASQGDYRLAMRAYFFASLAALAQRHLLQLARYKSNRDYARELARVAHAEPALPGLFTETARQLERVWYGRHEATADMAEEFARSYERMAAHAE